MLDKIIFELKPKMQQVIDKLDEDLKSIRTGRATPSLVEDILVPYYGASTPLKQIASINSPEGNLIVIQPWDKNILGDIESSIRSSNLGFNPVNDGQLIRIALPPLTEERRKEFVKTIHQRAESARIILRNLRADAWDEIKAKEKAGILTEDDRYTGEERLNKMIDEYNDKIELAVEKKEKDIMMI